MESDELSCSRGEEEVPDITQHYACVSPTPTRAVVVKDDDLMTRKEILENQAGVAEATLAELKTWIANTCFKMCLIKDAGNIMTSRYVAKWK